MEKILCKDCYMNTLESEELDSITSGEAIIKLSDKECECEGCGTVGRYALGLSYEVGDANINWGDANDIEGEECGGFDDEDIDLNSLDDFEDDGEYNDFDDFNEEDYATGDLNFDDLEFADTEDLSLNADDLDFGDEDISSDGDDNK